MLKNIRYTFLALTLTFSTVVFASAEQNSRGLVIHAAEWGVGKFHRKDNQVHVYPNNSSWAPFILNNSAQMNANPEIQKNSDNSYSIFFSTLDELMTTVETLVKQNAQTVQILNVHGHGLPGAMWFPRDQQTLNSLACYSWQSAAKGSDNTNYSQYYSAISAQDVESIRQASQSTSSSMGCTTGLRDWKLILDKHPQFKSVLAEDVKIHFLSCVVGLGKAGEAFANGLAALLLNKNSQAEIQTSVNFGLGDWSMPEGMGFWDYQTDEQLARDNKIYPKNRQDREIAQKGIIRKTQNLNQGITSILISEQTAMPLDESEISGPITNEITPSRSLQFMLRPMMKIRIPGTTFETSYVELNK